MTQPPDPVQLLQQAKRELALGDADRARLQADLLRNLDTLGGSVASAAAAGSSLALGKLPFIMALVLAAGGAWYARSASTSEAALAPTSSTGQARAANAVVGSAPVAQAGQARDVAAEPPQLNRTTPQLPAPLGLEAAPDPVVVGREHPLAPPASTRGAARPAQTPVVHSRPRAARLASPGPRRARANAAATAVESRMATSPTAPYADRLAQAAPTPSGSTQAPPSSADLLAAELTLIRAASRALSTGHPEQALQTLARHSELYGSGRLAQEREGLTAIAQCAAGQVAAARANAARFLARYPSAALATRVKSAARCEPAR